jgi:hypothetical protein
MSELHDPSLTALEAALAGLAPASGTVDRDAVLFRAGQAAAQRGWFWPAWASLSTAAALMFGVLLAMRTPPSPRVEYVYVPRETPELSPEPTPAAPVPTFTLPDYLRLQERVMEEGLDALPPSSPIEPLTFPDPLRGPF